MSGAAVVHVLDVWLDGQPAPLGRLEGLAGSTYPLRFTYAASYEGPPLSVGLPVRSAPYENEEARIFFDNLLPEGEQRRAVRAADAGRPVPEDDVAGLLEVIGAECPGAVSVVRPQDRPAKVVGDLDVHYESLSREQVGELLEAAARGEAPGRALRFSLAGVQRKIALAIDPKSGAFLRPREAGVPTTHLLKVRSGEPGFRTIVRNELLSLRLAKALGLPVCEAVADEIGGTEVLIVSRFDRVVDGRRVRRLHQEDAAQVMGLDRTEKYEDEASRRGKDAGLMALVHRISAAVAVPIEAEDLLRRVAFVNWLIGNVDAHAKNFAILYPEGGGRPNLAPFYDLVAVQAMDPSYDTMAMAFDGEANPAMIGAEHLRWLARLSDKRVPRSVADRRVKAFERMAQQALPAFDALERSGEFRRSEMKAVRDLVAARIRQANAVLGWAIPAEGDAPREVSGGWSLPS